MVVKFVAGHNSIEIAREGKNVFFYGSKMFLLYQIHTAAAAQKAREEATVKLEISFSCEQQQQPRVVEDGKMENGKEIDIIKFHSAKHANYEC